MPYNEALICNILYRHQMRDKVNKLTATDLCRQTKLLKSQMTRTLRKMEEKNIITRQRSSTDRRQIFISLNPNADSFYIQHHKSLRLIDALATKAGPEKSQEAIDLFTYIANMAEEMIEDNTES